MFWLNKKSCYVDIATECFLLWTICLYSIWRIDPTVSNQPTSYDESTLPWEWFVTWRTIFQRFYLHGYQSFMQTVYLTSWPRRCWIWTYNKIICCVINIKLSRFYQNHVEPTQLSSTWSLLFATYIYIHLCLLTNGPLTRYPKLRVAHAPGLPGTFPPPPTSKETASKRSRHASRHVCDARAVMHVGIANPGWRGKHSKRMRNSQLCVSGKRPIARTLYD